MTISYLGGFMLLVSLAMEDIREKKISVKKVAAFAAAAVLYRSLCGELSWGKIMTSLIPGTMLLLLAFLLKESIGTGDGIAVIALGLWTSGWFAFASAASGMVLSGIYGMFCLVRRKRDPFPFVPFLLLGMEVVLLYVP